MKTITRLFTFAIIACSVPLFDASAQFSLVLRSPAPGSLAPADLWQFDIIISSARVTQAYVVGKVHSYSTDADVYTVKSGAFALQVGTRHVTPALASTFPNVVATFQDSKVRDAVQQTGQFPAGEYSVTISLMSVASASAGSVELASDELELVRVESAAQPMLISPTDESSVELPTPVFTWTMPFVPRAGQTAGVTYRLRIVEVLGRQSPTAAARVNPSWFERTGLASTAFAFPGSARTFEKGHRYLWSVTAVAQGKTLGTSEVWSFVYEPEEQTPSKPTVTTTAKPAQVEINVRSELLKSCSTEISH